MVTSNSETIHANYLHNWMKPKHYYDAGLCLDDIVSILPEPIWTPNGKNEHHTMCDYIILLKNNCGIAAELKGSYHQRDKAKKQLISGQEYIEDVLDREYLYGLFIVYHPTHYSYQNIRGK